MEIVSAASDYFVPRCIIPTHPKFRHSSVANLNFSSSSSRTRISHKVKLSSHINPAIYFKEIVQRSYEAGKFDEALSFLEGMVGHGYKADVYFCTKLMKGFVDSNRFQKAVQVLEILESYGKPDVYAYTGIILGHCKLNQINSALQVFSRMRNRGLVPSLICYNSMLNMLLKNGEQNDAEGLLKDMSLTNCEPDRATFSILMHSFCHDEKMDEAMDLLMLAIEKGVDPDIFLMTPLISGWCKKRRLDMAVVCIDHMISHGCLPSFTTYNQVLSLLWRNGSAELAVYLFEKLQGAGCLLDVVTYNIMIRGLWLKSGDMIKAVRLVTEMIDRRIDLDNTTYTKLISCLCKDGFVNQAIVLLGIMGSNGIKPCVKDYNIVLRGLRKANRLAEAIELLEEMVLENGCQPDRNTYRTLIIGIGLAGMEEEAMEFADSLFQMGVLKTTSFTRCFWKPRTSLHWSAVDST